MQPVPPHRTVDLLLFLPATFVSISLSSTIVKGQERPRLDPVYSVLYFAAEKEKKKETRRKLRKEEKNRKTVVKRVSTV